MGISVTQLLIILAIVIVLFGTKRLKNLGADLGGAIRGFRSAVKEGGENPKSLADKDVDTLHDDVTAKDKDQV